MSRQAYAEALTYVDPNTGAFKPASNAEVFVYLAGTTNLATIYSARSGGSASSNPFIVPENALAFFWGDTGDYDIKFHDTKLPARFGDFTIGWQSSPVNVMIDSGELSSKGSYIEWSQEGSGAWLAKIKPGSIGLTELKSGLELPLGSLASSVQQSVFQSGDIKPSARSTPPTGWLLCNGASLLRSEYASLFSAIGTNYGAADGTHFYIPDIQGRVMVGLGTHADVNAFSDNDGLAVNSRTPKHAHGSSGLGMGGPSHGVPDAQGGGLYGLADNTHVHTITGNTAIGNEAYVVVNLFIKT